MVLQMIPRQKERDKNPKSIHLKDKYKIFKYTRCVIISHAFVIIMIKNSRSFYGYRRVWDEYSGERNPGT